MPSAPPVLIEIYGPGCARCKEAYRVLSTVLEAVGANAVLEKVESYERMAALGIMATPAVMVDGKLVVSGRVPTKDDIQAILAMLLANVPAPAVEQGKGTACECNGECTPEA